jgi:hypothetical protein
VFRLVGQIGINSHMYGTKILIQSIKIKGREIKFFLMIHKYYIIPVNVTYYTRKMTILLSMA